jgi:uncharacterized membrane protein
MQPLELVRGFPGKPSHPPLTDASIGAYTAGVAMLVLGALGVEEGPMAHGALLAISVGLVLAAPTALTGLADWLGIEPGTPARRVGLVHLLTMVTTTLVFAATWIVQLSGYEDEAVRGGAVVLGVVAELLLVAGGYLGGTLVFVYGVRVLKRRDTPVAEALVPGRSEAEVIQPDPVVRS